MSENQSPSRPGEAALQNMQILKSESSVFKVPKVPRQKNQKRAQVLDEEDYVEGPKSDSKNSADICSIVVTAKGISKIIQRDFFPDLEKLKAQNDFLEATENKDFARIREIARKYSGTRPPTEPYNSPATFDTPGVDRPPSPSDRDLRPPDTNTASKSTDITDNHSLDSFLASHTSEDNASYDRVIALENKKKASKLASQFEAEIKSKALVDSALALPSIDSQADQTDRPLELDTWQYRAKNYIMYVPDGAESQKPSEKPELQHHNTRLQVQPFDYAKNQEAISAIARSQGSNDKGKIGVDGVSISGDKPPTAYELLATPSPKPGVGPDQSPLMTWGEIEGTPFRLDGGDTPLPAVGAGAAYRILEGGARERIAMQLAEQVAKRRRPTTPRRTPTPQSFRTNTERLASMSPAARKLAAKHLLSPRLKLTPNDMGISHPPKSLTPRRPIVATPAQESGNPDNITDNLLQINVSKRTRLKAQDFFT